AGGAARWPRIVPPASDPPPPEPAPEAQADPASRAASPTASSGLGACTGGDPSQAGRARRRHPGVRPAEGHDIRDPGRRTTSSSAQGVAMSLVVGVPTETKVDEFRVAVTPEGVRELEMHGIEVLVQAGAGAGSGLPDEAYRAAGAEIVADPAEIWARSQIVCKVKEPSEHEFAWFRDDLTVFTFLHLAAYPKVADALLEHGTTGIAYETVQLDDGSLPLLAPMSEVAGRLSVQVGAHYLERHNRGRGVLLGGAPGVQPARVVVLGAGNVGWNSAWMAAGMEAEVNVLDKNVARLRYVDQIQMGRVTTLASNRGNVERV